jgi:hypothetical protein
MVEDFEDIEQAESEAEAAEQRAIEDGTCVYE